MTFHFGAFRKSQIRSALVNFFVNKLSCSCGNDDVGSVMIEWRFLMCNSITFGRANCLLHIEQKYPSMQRRQRDTLSPLDHWLVEYSFTNLYKRHWAHLRSIVYLLLTWFENVVLTGLHLVKKKHDSFIPVYHHGSWQICEHARHDNMMIDVERRWNDKYKVQRKQMQFKSIYFFTIMWLYKYRTWVEFDDNMNSWWRSCVEHPIVPSYWWFFSQIFRIQGGVAANHVYYIDAVETDPPA
jgi:hypothetical protein